MSEMVGIDMKSAGNGLQDNVCSLTQIFSPNEHSPHIENDLALENNPPFSIVPR